MIAVLIIIFLIILLLIVIFWQVSSLISVYGGTPYVSSKSDILRAAFRLAQLGRGEVFYELGSGLGDGLIIACREFQARCFGVEISPLHWLISKWRTAHDRDIKVFLGNFTKASLRDADVVYCYLLPKSMAKLQPKFEKELKPGSRVVSYAFQLPGLRPNCTRPVGKTKIYLYKF